ncbi:MAG TPA: hypothetical protein VFJ58_04830 [Armatimonadota bacterium]|nr:hypothetical protein [Armatimonadota bacterium]
MDHNRRGLALMMSALMISLLVVSVRSCNDTQSRQLSARERANQALIRRAPSLTQPITAYRIASISEGYMEVDATASLSDAELTTLATKLTQALHDAEHEDLGSDLVMVDIKWKDNVVCKAQTSARGIWVKLTDRPGPGVYVQPALGSGVEPH